MEIDSSFRYCRGCKLPENKVKFKSLFKELREYCKFFQSLAGIDISSDEDNNDALLCDKCWSNLDNSCVFIKCVRKTEEDFFKSFRKLNNSKAFENCRVCLKQEDATHLSDFFAETSDAVKILRLVSNVDISSDKNKFKAMICDKCIDILGLIYQYRYLIRNAEKTFFKVKRQMRETESKESERKASLRKYLKSNVKSSEIVGSPSSAKESPANRNSSKSDPLKCQICHKKFSTKQCLKNHISCVHEKIKNFYCDLCPASFYCKNEIQSHMGQHVTFDQRSWKCLVCQKFYTTKQNLKFHNERIHEKITFRCQLCEKNFTTKRGLKFHNVSIHQKITFRCQLCEKHFASRLGLKLHNKSIHEKITFRCRLCETHFAKKQGLKRHVGSVHQKLRNFHCDFCEKSYNRKDQLHSHVNAVHLKIRYECLLCNRKYTTKGRLSQHVKSVHEQIKRFICKICSKCFYYKHQLKTHQESHHK